MFTLSIIRRWVLNGETSVFELFDATRSISSFLWGAREKSSVIIKNNQNLIGETQFWMHIIVNTRVLDKYTVVTENMTYLGYLFQIKTSFQAKQ